MHSELLARLEAAADRWVQAYWALGAYVWSAIFVAAYFTEAPEALRNHLFLVAALHWATRDILAAIRAKGDA